MNFAIWVNLIIRQNFGIWSLVPFLILKKEEDNLKVREALSNNFVQEALLSYTHLQKIQRCYNKKMNKNAIVKVLSLVVLIGAALWLSQSEPVDALTEDYMTTKYELNGELVQLDTNGFEYFGNEIRGDFNNDGREDVAFVAIHTNGPGDISYYLAAAHNLEEGYEGMNTVFLGNNISPQTTEYGESIIIVNYGTTDVLTSPDQPTIGSSKFFFISNAGLEQVGESTF